jgi:two-component system NtrC family sensor kinase
MKLFLILILTFFFGVTTLAQEQVEVLSTNQLRSHERLFLAPLESWIFKNGDIEGGEKVNIDVNDWQVFNPTQLSKDLEDPNGRVEGWFRIKIKLDESFDGIPLAISRDLWAATDVYINGKLLHSFGDTGNPYRAFNPTLKYPIPVSLEIGREYLIALHFVDYETTFTQRELRLKPQNLKGFINLTGPAYNDRVDGGIKNAYVFGALSIAVSFLLFFLFWLLVFLNPAQQVFKMIALLTSFTLLGGVASFSRYFYELSYDQEKIRFLIENMLQPVSTIFGLVILEWILTKKISLTLKVIFILLLITNFFAHLFAISLPFGIVFMAMIAYLGYLLYNHRAVIKGAQLAIVASLVVPTITAFVWITIHKYSLDLFYEYDSLLTSLLTIGAPIFLLIYISVRFKELLNEVSMEAQKVIKVTEEKKELLANQNILLERQVEERTQELNQSLEDLKATQAQLIHSEKMASLGELTAGIAHEIQNPLNFVNNFSEVSLEIIGELNEELDKGDIEESKHISKDLTDNLEKINHHGQRASDIVKSMLEHSRSGDGKKEPTDINKLADEYLRLAYHGLRAKDKSFNADFELDLDESLPKVNVVPQDIGRVLLNLINNAFQAVKDVKKPFVKVASAGIPLPGGARGGSSTIQITVSDNGPGIPDDIKEKIFQPFFTTKPTGQGTGLGLSMSYDIVKAHGGELKVETKEGEGSTFIIILQKI